jgi:ornithine carbamoyltransferase
MMRHFLDIDELSKDELEHVLDLSSQPATTAPLAGKGMALLFENVVPCRGSRRAGYRRRCDPEVLMNRRMFVVGRSNRLTTTVVVLRIENGPIIGPFTLRAVVSEN